MSIKVNERSYQQVRERLAKEIGKVRGGSRKGMIKAGFVIKTASVRLAPIQTSNLRQSHYVYWRGGTVPKPSFKGGDKAKLDAGVSQATTEAAATVVSDLHVRVGASAFYALFVHEMPDSNTFNMGGPKFLQRAFTQNEKAILMIVAREAAL